MSMIDDIRETVARFRAGDSDVRLFELMEQVEALLEYHDAAETFRKAYFCDPFGITTKEMSEAWYAARKKLGDV